MTKFLKRTSVFALGVLASASVLADEPPAIVGDYTSSTAVADVDGMKVTQQIGACLSYPTLMEGDDIVRLGLFGILTGSDDSTLGVTFVSDSDGKYSMAYDYASNAIRLSSAESLSGKNLAVVDSKGNMLLLAVLNDACGTVSLPSLTKGIYIAAIFNGNSILKTLKFESK